MCCDFENGWCGHMNKKCYSCKGKASGTTYWGNIGNRYEVPVCNECRKSMAESDRKFSQLVTGFAEYNAYYDAKGK